MNHQQKKNHRTIALVFAMTIIPFCIAWYLSVNTEWMDAGTNKGELIIPPVVTEGTEFKPYDPFSKENMGELTGHWILVNIIPGHDCGKVCLEAMHKTKQLRLMMNKDLTRIRRLVILLKSVDYEVAPSWWKDDLRLLRVTPEPSLVTKLNQMAKEGIPDGVLLLMDPLGNIMMQYQAGFDPYDVKKDLGKLLRISQIG